MREWLSTAARSAVSRAAVDAAGSVKAAAKAAASGVAERIVSVLPCLKAAVDADSYLGGCGGRGMQDRYAG